MISKGRMSCIMYGVSSGVMNICNKSLVIYYGFKSPLLLLFFQYFLTVVVIEISRRKFSAGLPKFTWKQTEDSFLLSCCFLANIALSMYGLNFVNLPMYVTLRKLGILVVFLLDIHLNRYLPGFFCILGVAMISVGAVLSGYSDLTSDVFGYLLLGISNLMNGLQLHLAKIQDKKHANSSSWTHPYYTALISLPFVYILMFSIDEHVAFLSLPCSESIGFYFIVLIWAIIGILCNYFMFLCTTLISPMAVSISGNMKDIFIIVIGLFAFGDVELTSMFLIGILMSMVGGLVYTLAKAYEKHTVDPMEMRDK